jgi:hypothetical protein
MRAITLGSSLVVTALVGCSAVPPSSFTGVSGPGTGGTGTGAQGTSGQSGAGGGLTGLDGGFGVGGSSGASGCSQAAELVYVLSTDNSIWSFDPPSKQFTHLATLDCHTSMTPNSMAVDRDLNAWINYEKDGDDGAIFKFDLTQTSGCVSTPIALPAGFGQIGMGFSTDTAGGTAETLFIDGIGGHGLAKIDLTTYAVTPIGDFSNDANLTGQSAELTGTGDAKLYGYFTTVPYVRVAEIDKSTASIVSDDQLAGFTPPQDWAFSFWGGDFYLYTAPGSNTTGNSSVVHYSPLTNTVDLSYVADVGFVIVGAGVSTCAPVTPTTT